MTEPHKTDAAIIRQMAEQVADYALLKFSQQHQETKRAEIPAPLKWAAAIVSALMSAVVVAAIFWMASTLNNLQLTVARIDERQQSQGNDVSGQFEKMDQRITRLEELQRQEKPR